MGCVARQSLVGRVLSRWQTEPTVAAHALHVRNPVENAQFYTNVFAQTELAAVLTKLRHRINDKMELFPFLVIVVVFFEACGGRLEHELWTALLEADIDIVGRPIHGRLGRTLAINWRSALLQCSGAETDLNLLSGKMNPPIHRARKK